jgi:hypothetical protein
MTVARHDLYGNYRDHDSEISGLLGECGITGVDTSVKKATRTSQTGWRRTLQA